MTSRIPLTLYEHSSTDRALLLSRDGKHPHWIPRSQCTAADHFKLEKIGNNNVARRIYDIDLNAAKERGWLTADDPDQLNLMGDA